MNKLNLGCGNDKKKGFINCDISKGCNPDKIVDLECELPFVDNSVSYVTGDHLLEHITNFIPLMEELHRVCKNGAILEFTVPFYSFHGFIFNPTHVRAFSPFTFHFFDNPTYYGKAKFKVLENKIIFGVGKLSFLNFIFNPIFNKFMKFYVRFLAWVIPSEEIRFRLEVLK